MTEAKKLTTLRIDRELWKRARIQSIKENKQMYQWIREAIEAKLKEGITK